MQRMYIHDFALREIFIPVVAVVEFVVVVFVVGVIVVVVGFIVVVVVVVVTGVVVVVGVVVGLHIHFKISILNTSDFYHFSYKF